MLLIRLPKLQKVFTTLQVCPFDDTLYLLLENPGGWLSRELQVQFVEKDLVILLRLRVSRENQQPPIGRGHPYIHHLARGHLFQHSSRTQARCQSSQALPQRDIQTESTQRYEHKPLNAEVF